MSSNYRPRISVIGAESSTSEANTIAYNVGCTLAQSGYDLVCGGLGGVMKFACMGCVDGGGNTIGILPNNDLDSANEYVTIPIATGLGNMRNALVVENGIAVIAIDGEYGTLSEIGLALKTQKKVISIGRWSHIDGTIQTDSAVKAVTIIQHLFPIDKTNLH